MQFKSSDEFVDFLIGAWSRRPRPWTRSRRRSGGSPASSDACPTSNASSAHRTRSARSARALGGPRNHDRPGAAARGRARRCRPLRAALRGAIDQAGAEEEKAAGAVRDLEREGGLVREERSGSSPSSRRSNTTSPSLRAGGRRPARGGRRATALRQGPGRVLEGGRARWPRRNDLRVQSEEIGRLLDGRAREAEPERRAVERAGFALRRGVTQVAEVADVAAERGTARSQELRRRRSASGPAPKSRCDARPRWRRTWRRPARPSTAWTVSAGGCERRGTSTTKTWRRPPCSAGRRSWRQPRGVSERSGSGRRVWSRSAGTSRDGPIRRSSRCRSRSRSPTRQDAVARIEAERRAIWDDPRWLRSWRRRSRTCGQRAAL